MGDPPPRTFRAIIVGGGVAGLSMANALSLAGIEWILLERRAQIPELTGAGIGIWPHNHALLHQFGVLDDLKRTNGPLHWTVHLDPKGREISRSNVFDAFARRAGGVFEPFLRADLIAKMWEKLPGKEGRVRTGCEVVAIEQDEKKVVVSLANGSEETGDILIGADGVHSRVREIMWEHANRDVPGTVTTEDKRLLTTRYKCMYGLSRLIPSIQTGTVLETHNQGFIFHIFAQPTHIFWFLYIKLDKPNHWPERSQYTEVDKEKLVLEYGKRHITQQVLFEDIWNARTRSQLASIEEGVQKRWFWKRICLVGDSAHKMTSNLAFGANNALESVTVLTNLLQQLPIASTSPAGYYRSPSELEAVFSAYQKERYSRALLHTKVSGNYVSSSAWETRWDIWMTYLPRYLGGLLKIVFVSFFIFLFRGAPRQGIRGVSIREKTL